MTKNTTKKGSLEAGASLELGFKKLFQETQQLFFFNIDLFISVTSVI